MEYLSERVRLLLDLAEKICKVKIKSFSWVNMNSVLKIIVLALRIICLPLKLITDFIYGNNDIVAYSWYTPAEYAKLLKVAENEENAILIPSYDLWQLNAEESIERFTEAGLVVIKFDVQIADLEKWLKSKNLKNISKNREKYVYSLFRQELQYGLRISNKKIHPISHSLDG